MPPIASPRARRRAGLGALALLLSLLLVGVARADAPVARAVLFFSPTCPHCHVVLEETLPPLQARYGAQLQILTVDVSQPDGQALYQAAVGTFAVPQERLGVPALFFDRTLLVGSAEIPAMLPAMIEAALAAGGNSWPAIPGLAALTDPLDAGAPLAAAPAASPFSRDPLANTIALLVLTGMVVVIFIVLATARRPYDRALPAGRSRLVPGLALVGAAVAAYLAFVETSGATAVCGPVGDCNAVQQSAYARIFGVPVGVLGLLGYLGILAAWAARTFGRGQLAHLGGLALPGLALGGTLVSLYLTFLEPFVIGATCAWCLASAIIMTALLWLVAPRGAAPAARGRPRPAAHAR